jgi:hypothetical protein
MWKMDDKKVWTSRRESLDMVIDETIQRAESLVKQRQEQIEEIFANKGVDDPFDLLASDYEDWPAECKVSIPRTDVYQLLFEGVQLDKSVRLLRELKDFSENAFQFFLEALYEDGGGFPPSKRFPRRFVMRKLLDQVSIDIDCIQQTIHQRQGVVQTDDETMYRGSQQGKTLYIADRLARLALAPAIKGGYLPAGTAAITYLDRRIRSRLVPYHNTLLIGVAFSTMQLEGMPTRDYLAIPHEVGHLIYWNGMMPGTTKPVRREVLDRAKAAKIYSRNWQMNWVEELFSDVYAMLVAGPVSVLDFQDMLDDDIPTHFSRDSDKHPIPELRPMILTRVLEQITDSKNKTIYKNSPDKLETNWVDHIKANPRRKKYKVRKSAAKMTGARIIKHLDTLIEIILDVLSEARPSKESPSWTRDLAKTRKLGTLYNEFRTATFTDRKFSSSDLIQSLMADLEQDAVLDEIKDLEPGEIPDDLLTKAPAFYRRMNEWVINMDSLDTSAGELDVAKMQTDLTEFFETFIELVLFMGWSDEGTTNDPGGRG